MLLRTGLLISFLFSSLYLWSQQEEAASDSMEYKVYYYEGGTKSSEGFLRKGKPDGYWKSYYRNGNLKAEGNRQDFALDGPWIFYSPTGEKNTEINYRNGQKQGLRKTFKEGQVIKEEQFEADKLQGFTRHYLATGELHKEVPYEDDKAQGEGYEYDKDGRTVTLLTYKNGVLTKKQRINRYDEQKQKQGLWMSFHDNRQVKEEGTYVNGLKHGYWKYYRNNGDLIRVEKWVMGELQEDASEVAKVEIKREINPSTGKLAFKGSYRNGVPEGLHREYDDEGNVVAAKIYEKGIVLFEGVVDEQGRRQGPWKEYYRSGELKAEGSYRDNLKVGKWNYYYRSGQIEQTGNYQRGQPDGLWVWYFEDGNVLREEEYLMGREDGPSVEYSDSGTVIARGDYVDGFREGKWYYEINDHREEGKYFEGERTGIWKHYYLDNGELRFEGRYENGMENGVHTYYYPNGQVKRRGNYLAGERHGLWEYFDESGGRILSIEYEQGEEVKYNGDKIRYGKRYERLIEREAEGS